MIITQEVIQIHMMILRSFMESNLYFSGEQIAKYLKKNAEINWAVYLDGKFRHSF